MKKINQQQAPDEVRYFRVVETGECLYGLIFSWGAKVDLSDKTYVLQSEESEHSASTLPTINELFAQGILEVVNEIDELDITEKDVDMQDFDAVVAFAKQKGFNVEREAFVHNFESWQMDLKSGYRGRECHVFSPCGCNPLRYGISKLDDRVDWQTTYRS